MERQKAKGCGTRKKGNDRKQDNSKQRTVHRSIYARRWQQRTGSLNIANRLKDAAAFFHVTKGLLDEAAERIYVIL